MTVRLLVGDCRNMAFEETKGANTAVVDGGQMALFAQPTARR